MSEILPPEGDPAAPIPAAQQQAATAAHQMDQRIREIRRMQRGLWVVLAEQLYHFRAGQMWRDIGYSSFERWLADPEVDLERRWVYKLTDAYRWLVIEWELPRERVELLPISKVNEVLPAVRRGQVQLEAALADVENLSRGDLEIQYRGTASSTPGSPVAATSTAIETEHEPEWAVCPTCGSTYARKAP